MTKNELVKPSFDEEIKAEIKGIATIENNINLVKEYAISLKEYYADITFTEEDKKDAEEQKAQVNKQIKQVSDFRKQIIAKYNEPIKQFEETAKETEKILKETYELINEQVKVFDLAELEKVKEKVNTYFQEYATSKGIDFVKLEDMNISITRSLVTATGSLTKKITEQIATFIDSILKDIELINSTDYKEEILIEYKKTLQCGSSIIAVQERHKELEKMKSEPLTDEVVQEKINYVSAPKVEDAKLEMTFKVIATREKLKELKDFLDRGGYDYE